MTDITKLPDEWNNIADCPRTTLDAAATFIDCADKLEAALPKWTRVTDDPDTWPENNNSTILVAEFITIGRQIYTWESCNLRGNNNLFPIYWRPLCDLDHPPEDKS